MSRKMWVIFIQGDQCQEKERIDVAICEDFSEAHSIIQECYAFFFRLVKRLPPVLPVSDPQWYEARTKRADAVSRVRWPYGINLESEVSLFSNEANGGFLGSEELKVVKQKRQP